MSAGSYPLRVKQNILPLSIADNLPAAFDEWFFTEETYDHETPDAECHLCDKEEIRYHFQIRNKYTEKELWVGSQCILKFGLAVYESGLLLEPREAKRKLSQLTKKMQLESCIKALEALAVKENNDILSSALKFYKTNKYLTPKFAFVVFRRLDKNRIDHHPSFFRIGLRKRKYQNDLKNMPSDRVHIFWKALTATQRKLAASLGHSAPK